MFLMPDDCRLNSSFSYLRSSLLILYSATELLMTLRASSRAQIINNEKNCDKSVWETAGRAFMFQGWIRTVSSLKVLLWSNQVTTITVIQNHLVSRCCDDYRWIIWFSKAEMMLNFSVHLNSLILSFSRDVLGQTSLAASLKVPK